MEDAENCVEDVRTIQRLLKAETELRNIDSADTQVRGGIFCILNIDGAGIGFNSLSFLYKFTTDDFEKITRKYR